MIAGTEHLKEESMTLLPTSVATSQTSAAPAIGRRWRRWFLAGTVLVLLVAWLAGRQLWAWQHFRDARQALQRHDFPDALDHFERCLRVWPGSFAVQIEAARAARRGNQLERCEEHLSVCEKHGVTPETALERALLRAQEGDLSEVELPLQQLIQERSPEAVLIIEALVRGYMQVLRLGHAMAALEDLLQRDPDHQLAHYWRGKLLEESERLADAVVEYRRAVEIDPQRTDFRLRLAQAQLRMGNARDAWPHFAVLLKQTPSDPNVLLASARCQRQFGDFRQAHLYLKTLLDERPDHAEGWAERGRIANDQGNTRETLRCLRRAFELNLRDYTIGFALFNELNGQGEKAEANVIWERIERLKRAEERFRELLVQFGKDGRNVAVRHELGTICLRNENENTAIRWFNSVLQLDPAYRPTHEILADYYQRRGNAAAAAYHRERAESPAP
jgi:tetratricopeptide (TPR) repeat protein